MIAALFERLGRLLVRRRVAATVLLAICTAAVVVAAGPRLSRGLPVDFSPQALFMKDAGNLALVEQVEAAWGRDDNEAVVLVELDVFSPAGLSALRALHAALEAVEGVERVDSLASAEIAARDAGGALIVGPLLPAGEPSLSEISALKTRALSQQAIRGLLVSPDGRLAQLRAALSPDLERVEDQAPVVERIRAAVMGVPLPTGASAAVSGVPVVRTEIVDQLNADQMRFVPLNAILFAGVLIVLFRGPLPGLLPLIAVGIAVLWGLGGMVAAGVTFNVLSILVPTLVLVIGIADGIHLLTRYREEIAADGNREAAMGRTLRHLGGACFLTSFTTAIGFCSLISASSPLIRDFGVHSAIGVLVAYLAVLLALPTMLAWVPTSLAGARSRVGAPSRLEASLGALDAAVAARPGLALGGALLLSLAALAVGAGVQTNSHMLEMYSPEHPTVATYERILDHGGGLVPMMVHLEAEGDVTFKDPEQLARLAALEAAVSAEPDVRWAISPAALIASIHGLLTGAPGLPEDPFLLEQELMVAEMGGGDLGLSRLVSDDWRQARILALATDAGGHAFIAIGDRLDAEGAAIFEGSGITARAAGDGIVASRGVHRIIDDLLASVGLAFAVIFATLWALLRSARAAAVAMVPNALTLCFTLATIYVVGGELITSNVVSFAVALGIAVDDTIHFLVRLREERGRQPDGGAAIRAAMLGAGPALVFTTTLLGLGLGVLMLSELTSTWHFGVLATSSLIAALVADLVVLPAILRLIEGRGGR